MRRFLTAAATAAALLLTGCAGPDTTETPATQASSASYPVTVGSLTLDKRPERIVSLSPTGTEMLFAIGAGPQVVAADDNSNYPPEAPKSDLSGFKPNAEAIGAQRPDLVVLSNDLNNVVASLTALKVPVYVAPSAQTLDDTYRQLTEIGSLTGHGAEAAALTERTRADIATLAAGLPQRAEPLTYYYELDQTYYSATSTTFIGSLFALLGMRSIADKADPDGSKGGYPQLSKEAVLAADPDMIFLADTKCCGQTPATVRDRTGWATLAAVQHDRIVALDDDVASRWGPRVVDLVRAITSAAAKVPA